MANYSVERKNYNKFTAQISKNVVKKKIIEIRTRGARAADELIDDLIEKAKKESKNPQNSLLGRTLGSIIEKNRVKWRNFIIELAGRFDPDSLAIFGVNLIYGGILTSSAGNSGWASVISLDRGEQGKLSEFISKGRNRGSLVWILRGREAFSPETIKTCRYFPECAFVLASEGDFDASVLSNSKNILVLLKKGDQKGEKELLGRGIPYIFADMNEKGRGEIYSSLPPSLYGFLEAPRFPIVIENLSDGLNSIEYLLSGGKNKTLPYYFA